MVLDRIATAEKDNDLLFQVALEKAEEEEESLVAVAYHIPLLEHINGRCCFALIDVDVQRSGTKRHARQVGDFGGLRSGEEHGLAVLYSEGQTGVCASWMETWREATRLMGAA